MLQLKMPSNEIVMDESGQVVGVQPEDTSYPHTIIEMFMVEANVAVATLLDRYCVPFMRRIHPEPDAKVLRQLSQTLRLLGVTLSRQPQRSDLQALLDRVRDTRMGLPVQLLVLRSLAKATYAPRSVGHYALAASKYCHFTSPIRRHADLMVHRALQAYLDRARVIHLHGSVKGRDHRGLELIPKAVLNRLLALLIDRRYRGVLTLEVFTESHFYPGRELILSLMEAYL